MHLLYVDESGLADERATDQPLYFLTATVVPESQWYRFDRAMRGVIDMCRRRVAAELWSAFSTDAALAETWARKVLNGKKVDFLSLGRVERNEFETALTAYLIAHFEIHAEPLYRGTKIYEGVSWATRQAILGKIFDTLDGLKPSIVSVGVNKTAHAIKYPNPQHRPDVGAYCFSLLVERLDAHLVSMGTGHHGLLIADGGSTDAGQQTRLLKTFQRSAATMLLGKQIERVIENLHFVNSVHSTGVQTADLCGYFIRHQAWKNAKTVQWQARVAAFGPHTFVLP